MKAIEIDGLRKTYGNGVKALNGITFAVEKGEIFGLLGPNGAGKSTTVRVLVTLTRADEGKAFVGGCDVFRDPAGVRRKIGYVAQETGVDKHATGRENLVLQARLQRVPAKEIASRVDELLAWVRLTDHANQLVKTYSGGMKRRLDIAMGLVHNPEILFLDEPTTGLDPESRSALWHDLFRLRKERDLTILLTTHYLEEADHLCDRLAIVNHGKVVVEGDPDRLKEQIEGDTVELDVEEGREKAADLLKELDPVLDVISDGRTLIARVSQGGAMIPSMLNQMEKAGIRVASVSLSRPSLDDVYLHHTGHRLESGGDKGGQ